MDREQMQYYVYQAVKELGYSPKERDKIIDKLIEVMDENWISYSGKQLVKPIEIEGVDILSKTQQEFFEKFLRRFYRSWEIPEVNIPIRVIATNKDGKSFKVNFLRYGYEEEYEVKQIGDEINWARI